jgi:Flp pilus assembly pilin Flp
MRSTPGGVAGKFPLRRLFRSTAAQDLVEYAMLAAAVALIVVGALVAIGKSVSVAFDTVGGALPSGGSSAGNAGGDTGTGAGSAGNAGNAGNSGSNGGSNTGGNGNGGGGGGNNGGGNGGGNGGSKNGGDHPTGPPPKP